MRTVPECRLSGDWVWYYLPHPHHTEIISIGFLLLSVLVVRPLRGKEPYQIKRRGGGYAMVNYPASLTVKKKIIHIQYTYIYVILYIIYYIIQSYNENYFCLMENYLYVAKEAHAKKYNCL